MRLRSTLALLPLLAVAATASAQDTGSFVVRLGNDTTSVEGFTRTPQRLEVDQVGRVPRVLQRRFVYDFGPNGATTRASALITAPGAAAGAPPVQQIDVSVAGDSATVTIKQDTTTRVLRVGTPAGTLVASNSAPWSIFEGQTVKLAAQKGADSLRVPMYLFGAPNLSSLTVRRLGRDSMVIQTANDRYHAKVDAAGHIQGSTPISGTQKYSADRVARLDLPAMAAAWSAREKASGAMGQLSTRDTVSATLAGASLWVDYSRPAKRGRVIFGNVVPYGELWRTGANAATQFKTDKNLQFGSVKVPAGFYTLFTIPAPNGWQLIINGETGQPGTQHNAEKDLFKIPMKVSALSEPVERFTISVAPGEGGGVLNLDWDTTRASVSFAVVP